jgi:hypothetical protein
VAPEGVAPAAVRVQPAEHADDRDQVVPEDVAPAVQPAEHDGGDNQVVPVAPEGVAPAGGGGQQVAPEDVAPVDEDDGRDEGSGGAGGGGGCRASRPVRRRRRGAGRFWLMGRHSFLGRLTGRGHCTVITSNPSLHEPTNALICKQLSTDPRT